MESYQKINYEINLESLKSHHIFESGSVLQVPSKRIEDGKLAQWVSQLISWVLLDGGDLVRRVAPGQKAQERWEYENLQARESFKGIGRIF